MMDIITRKEAKEKGLSFYFTGKPCSEGHILKRRVSNYGCVLCEANSQKHRNKVKMGMAEPKPKRQSPRKDAIEAGESFYFTGKPCPYGHIAKRHVSSGCVDCWSMHGKRNYERHKSKRNEQNKNNAHKYSDQRREYAKKHKEYFAQKKREYNAMPENKLAMLERCRKWKEKNPEKRKEAANRYATSGKGLAKLRMRQTMIKKACPDWACQESIALKYKERKAMTNMTGILHHVDHKIPLQGENICGLHVAANLRVITARDNLSKHNKWEIAA